MGQYHHATQTPIAVDSQSKPAKSRSENSNSPLLAEILKEAAKHHYERAISLSHARGGQDLDIVNALGVCLMRIGKHDEAVTVFRRLVMQPGCTWMRVDRPIHFKTNFATALLLSGRPNGCLEMLHELGADAPAVAGALRGAIKRWETRLSLWKWLDWKLYGSAPSTSPVLIDFEPGDFGIEAVLHEVGSGGNSATPPRNVA